MSLRSIARLMLVPALLASPFCAQAEYVETEGGIEVFRSDDSRYWFKLHGVIKADATFFVDGYKDRRNEFPSGTNLRGVETNFQGGIGKDLTYNLTLGLESGEVDVNDAYLTYHGFNNVEISVGQVISPFCLENANSGKWIPFLERSLPVTALRPCLGIGVNVAHWGDNHYLNVASTTPLHGTNKDSGSIMHRSDKLTNTARFVYAPVKTDREVIQVGVSGVYAENSPTFRDGTPNTDGRRFSTRPEARARNTPVILNSGNMLMAKHYTEVGAEAAAQSGPLLVQGEYLQADVHRKDNPNVRFYGWHAQVAYMLTGEKRAHSMKGASFGGVKPRCDYGAWEVAARHSMLNLNDADVHGGRAHNTSVSLGWYVNTHVKVMANYVRSNITPTQELGANNPNPAKRHLDIFGLRTQIVW